MKTTSSLIPRPAAERWRDIRFRHIPVLVYVLSTLAVLYLWNTHWMPGTFVGEVQSNVGKVASSVNGLLVEVSAQPFDRVTNGQVLGKVVIPFAADDGAAAAQSDLLVNRARMVLDNQRNDQGYQQLKSDLLEQKVNLAMAESKLRFAESELARAEKLIADKIVSQFEYEFALDTRDVLAAEVKQRRELINEMEKTLAAMKSTLGENEQELIVDTINRGLAAQKAELQTSGESVLRANFDGVITAIHRNQGENVAAGEPLISISGEQANSIVGYIRQPVTYEPKAGDKVWVRSRRGNQRHAAEAHVVKVGARVDLLMHLANESGFDPLRERGLPVLINLPEKLVLYPGELVELTFKN